jgi:transposase InsO family protein
MLYFLLAQTVSLLLDLCAINRRSERHKDLQILLLRQQLRILQRRHPQTPRVSPWEKLTLAVLASKLNRVGRHSKTKLDKVLFLFKPNTVLRWHRDLVRRKWKFTERRKLGWPPTAPQVKELLLRLANENPTWGYGKLQGELRKLGYEMGRSTVRDILKGQQVPPAPERAKRGSNWGDFLSHYREQFIVCDFFTVETAWLKTLYVFFFIELGSRRVHFVGCTAHPTAEWVTQQARQLTWTLQDEQKSMRFLIRARDAKCTESFDTGFAAEGIAIVQTPYRAPKANAFAERWIRSVRGGCLDQLLLLGEGHLRQVMIEYVVYYNRARPHQGIEQRCPLPIERGRREGPVKCRNVLGGIVHDYYRAAA